MTKLSRRRARAAPHRLTVAALEDRSVPAVLWVNSPADSGPGSLREALAVAGDGDEIRFDPVLYDVPIQLTTGQLVVEDSVTITGFGADHLAVERLHANPDGSLNPAFRIFQVLPKRAATITDLTVRYGLVGQVFEHDPIVARASGGGILNHLDATLTVTDSLVRFNHAAGTAAYAQGGGIHNDGTLVLADSTVFNNFASGGSAILPGTYVDDGGAGIENFGTLTLDRVVVYGNLVGALWDPFPNPPPTPLGYVSGNAGGGGISSSYGSTLTLARTVVYANDAHANSVDDSPVGTTAGGGLAVDGWAVIEDSLVDQNYAQHGPKIGRAGYALGAGVYVGPRAELTMARTAVTNNHANADRSRGGGLYVLGIADLTDTTVSTNLASWVTVPPSRAWNQYGGGIAVMGTGVVGLRFSTVVDNNATTYFPNGVPGNGEVEGGGLFVGPDARALLDSAIVARNQAGAGPAPFMDHDPTPGQDVFGEVKSAGYNLIGNADESTGWVAGDLTGTTPSLLDPVLGPLQDNGGPWLGYEPLERRTLTHEVLNGSPALQAGNPATASATDQRGVDRDDPRPNIGAYEATLAQFLVEIDPWQYPVYAGMPVDVTVTAADPYGKTVYVYRGTVEFNSSHPAAVPVDYTFTAADAGRVTFYGGVTFWTAGPQSLTVSDVAQPSIEGVLEVVVEGW